MKEDAKTYRISSIRRRGSLVPTRPGYEANAAATRCPFCAATIRGRLLFQGGIYVLESPETSTTDGWIRYVRVRRWRLLDAVRSTRSLSVLLSAVGTTRTAQTVLALVWWPSSEIIRTRVRVPRLLAEATIRGRRLFRSRASDCAATIRGRLLFEGGVYSKKYGNYHTAFGHALSAHPLFIHLSIFWLSCMQVLMWNTCIWYFCCSFYSPGSLESV